MAIIGIDLGTSNSAAAVLRGCRPVIVPSAEGISLRGKAFTPEQLSAFLLQKIKRDAEAFLGEKVEKAVVTVPAYLDDNQRSATKDACRIAGLEVARLVNEPTAASLAYGLDRIGEDLRIAVIDFGGGTLDVTAKDQATGKSQSITISKKDARLAAEKTEKLTQVVKEAGVVVYSQQSGSGVYKERKVNDMPSGQSAGSGHENVVDADYEESP